MIIKPLSSSDFKNNLLRNTSELSPNDYELYFKPCIQQAKVFATAPYFWLIPNQENMTLVAASDTIGELTPYLKKEWIGQDSNFWINTIHPDDRGFLAGAISMAVQVQETMTTKKAERVRLNIYCRMLDFNSNYRWVLIQFPKNYYNKRGKICSTLILTSDLSHLQINLKCMMTLIDHSDNKFEFFSASIETQKFLPLNIPSISKREHEILQLMTKGLNSPEIAEQLYLSYHTVENHKRNLRKKTNSKTSAELIHFVWSNNLI